MAARTPRYSGKKIKPAWMKHAKKAIPAGANVHSIGRKRKDGSRMVQFTTKSGRVLRFALLEPVAHKAIKLPADVMQQMEARVPKNATGIEVTGRGKKFRVLYTVKGKKYRVFVWQKRSTEYRVFPTQKLEVTRITRAGKHVSPRTVRKTVVE